MDPMYWIEEEEEEPFVVPDDIVDLSFTIRCQALQVDHAYALAQAVAEALPWFESEPQAGLHLIHGADSGNGWYRPEEGDALIYPSRRTPLVLRLPKERVEDARALTGQTLDLDGFSVEVGEAKERMLSNLTSLYARHVVTEHVDAEERFLEEAVARLKEMGIKFKKVLGGLPAIFRTPEGPVATRSLLVAGLSIEDAVRLQQEGIGPYRKMGCGLFIPHKQV
ncbi:MAG TPA: type I-MYXAN CRISPR-associated protein Cas6/Cmx6 [Gammaproteobacteria bacterium]|nr:type I-MYXAN CRISPR-associated protein Cas6/Cmx6 [Gammaproteobacteria bacterium]